MTGLSEVVAAVAIVGAAYCAGGLNGLWLAWTQPARMDRWAARADRLQRKINDLEGIER